MQNASPVAEFEVFLCPKKASAPLHCFIFVVTCLFIWIPHSFVSRILKRSLYLSACFTLSLIASHCISAPPPSLPHCNILNGAYGAAAS